MIANGFLLVKHTSWVLLAMLPLFACLMIAAGTKAVTTGKLHLRICNHGAVLLCIFLWSLPVSAVYHIVLWVLADSNGLWAVLQSALWCYALAFLLFWDGMICVYAASVQLGVRSRAVGLLCGMIPILNLIMLKKIIDTVMEEVAFETEKERLNLSRRQDRICATRYPILLVHGVFFRDSRFFNYWGRIPEQLRLNGAELYYGEHPSAASVADSAAILAKRIKRIVKETGCEKVNVIAHSKGGLDCRYLLSETDAADHVASLTTVNTPHHGCLFADALLEKIPDRTQTRIARTYEATLDKFGEHDADFLAAIRDLTAEACEKRNEALKVPEGVFCQSIGSWLETAGGGRFPLNLSYRLVKHFDGKNDGLVSTASFVWGETCRIMEPPAGRGISHGDMIDLNRENIRGFDVRECYVELVSDLKARGL